MAEATSSPPPFRGREGTDRHATTDRPTTDQPPTTNRLTTNDRLPIDPAKATFVILTAKDKNFKLSSVNSFIVKKVLDGNVGDVINCKKLASGDLLVETRNVLQVRSLLKLRLIHDIEVEASIPVSMNSCRGVVSHRDFMDSTSAQILDGMASQNVIEVRHITKMINGERRNTASCILTFASSKLPMDIKVNYDNRFVRPYIPNPLRCYKCQLFGHHTNSCRSTQSFCSRCAAEGHVGEACLAVTEKCRNCGDAHSSSSRDCPSWKVEKEICTLKATDGISYGEARKRVMEAQATPSPSVSFASTVQARPEMCTTACQTDPLPDVPAPSTSTLNSTTVQTSDSTSTSTTTQASSTKPSTSSSTPRQSSTSSTSSSLLTSSKYSSAVSTSKGKEEKNVKSDKLNFTTLQRPSHVAATPAPSRKGSHARSLSSSSGELVIDEDMEVSSGKYRERSPGSAGRRKKSKNHGHTSHS